MADMLLGIALARIIVWFRLRRCKARQASREGLKSTDKVVPRLELGAEFDVRKITQTCKDLRAGDLFKRVGWLG